MSWRYRSGTIVMTRGDTPSFEITINIKDENGNLVAYEPQDEDEIVFAVKRRASDTECVIEKEIPHDTMLLEFEEEDTKELPFGEYIYEVSLNRDDYHCTFITNQRLRLETEIY